MNQIDFFDQLGACIDYLESILKSGVKLDFVHRECGKLFGVSGDVVKRFFPLVVGLTISDYLTRRRLTLSAKDIIKNNKVLDTAIAYGYDTGEGFSKAFKKEFGVLPNGVKNFGAGIDFFEKIEFKNNIKKRNKIEFKVCDKQEITLYGRSYILDHMGLQKRIASIFKDLDAIEGEKLEDDFYCILTYNDDFFNPTKVTYHVLSDDKRFGDTKEIIKAGKYIVFRKQNGNDEMGMAELVNKVYPEFSTKKPHPKIQEIEFYSNEYSEYWLYLS